MASSSLNTLAEHLGVPERTLRRAAAEGLVRGERTSARKFVTSMREEAYLRTHWPLLSGLRAALRTEPGVRLAVMFGSLAAGTAGDGSDIDLLVRLGDPSARRVAELTGRLEERIGRDVQLVRIQDAERTPLLMRDALEQGRVLIDREHEWAGLVARLPTWRRRARTAETSLLDAMPDLDLGRTL
ncbi:nucleotidyltransferase domain-containing protein [Conexibacter sp. JD483]|uniref:nucleotidyltransferase family protein n=1 Tax=unclassified Conexibacter TaxID=2627773 RepID=UPI0027239D95|nr:MULTISPECIES: nucleotidyltransferase domain-containing protein [unclassified Conexibacter]MDO8186583.1 nucleotidyltransferase domain-containing protein [Conexibacter sp. CPCC 205706]MDO8196688.1 nucleotidyltransferase domain-containing protein [Conexibacter sp. CPCC 205762]MDR9372658.1 nucleotidyltransferase domain-containing protein [Conexibacter sp. JD483]